jgi:hypothetical protein
VFIKAKINTVWISVCLDSIDPQHRNHLIKRGFIDLNLSLVEL